VKKERVKKDPIKKDSRKKSLPAKNAGKRNHYTDLAGLAIIILLGIVIYSNSFNCSFHLDDLHHIVDNKNIRDLSDVSAWWSIYPSRPFSMFTFVLNYHFNELDVRYYHLVNLIIHLINACLVWWITLLVFSSPAVKDQEITRHKRALAFFTALLFVSHPLATGSVTYIIQRMASLAALFYLLSVALYLKARMSGKVSAMKVVLFAGSFLSAVLAILSKENAFTLPLMILLAEFFFIRTKKLPVNFRDYRVILLTALLALILIIPLIFRLSVFKPVPANGHPEFVLTPFNYLLTQFSVILKYIQLLFIPVNQVLDYDFPISKSFFGFRTLTGFVVLSGLLVLAVFLFKRNRVISFGISWFFLALLIESSIIPINDVIFEHRTYLPSYGFFLVLTTVIFGLLWKKNKIPAVAILVIVAGINSFLTYERNEVWKDEITLWTDNVLKTPGKARPLTILGDAYRKVGEFDKAMEDYSRAIAIDPRFETPRNGRGSIYFKQGQWQQAINDFSTAIEISPRFADAWSNRSAAYEKTGQWDKALSDINKAIGLAPDFYTAYVNRGAIYWKTGQPDKALADMNMAIELNPGYATAYLNRGLIYMRLKQSDKAIADLTRTIQLDPNNPAGYYHRGLAWESQGAWEKAISDFTQALGIDPNFKPAYASREEAYRKVNGGKSQ
jgi:protein O-mannosyl-transferase